MYVITHLYVHWISSLNKISISVRVHWLKHAEYAIIPNSSLLRGIDLRSAFEELLIRLAIREVLFSLELISLFLINYNLNTYHVSTRINAQINTPFLLVPGPFSDMLLAGNSLLLWRIISCLYGPRPCRVVSQSGTDKIGHWAMLPGSLRAQFADQHFRTPSRHLVYNHRLPKPLGKNHYGIQRELRFHASVRQVYRLDLFAVPSVAAFSGDDRNHVCDARHQLLCSSDGRQYGHRVALGCFLDTALFANDRSGNCTCPLSFGSNNPEYVRL